MELGCASRSTGGVLMEALEVLRQCFPESGGTPVTYVAVAGRRGLRWILPAQSQRITGLMAAWRPYSFPARLGWGLMRLAAKGGLLPRLPGKKLFEADISNERWKDFGWEKEKPPIVVIYVGTPGPHQKLVITLADPLSGDGCLVVKYPLVQTAWPKIANEYDKLVELRDVCSRLTPCPIHIDYIKRFSVQTYIPGRPVSINLTDHHYHFLAQLSRSEASISLKEVRDEITARRVALMETGQLLDKDRVTLEELIRGSSWDAYVSSVITHGDFAPWNLKQHFSGEFFCVDWEDAQLVGLPFYDLHYYRAKVELLTGRKVKIAKKVYLSWLSRMGYNANLKTLYAADRAAQCIALMDAKYKINYGAHSCN